MLDIEVEQRDDCVLFELDGRIDSNTCVALEERVLEEIDDGADTLVMDFQSVRFISSAGLRVLLLAAKKVKPSGGKVKLAALSTDVQEVFDISGFSAIFEIYDDAEEALDE